MFLKARPVLKLQDLLNSVVSEFLGLKALEQGEPRSLKIKQDYERHSHFLKILPRKEVIQPHLPIRLPCYDFTPIAGPTFDRCLPSKRGVGPRASGVADSRGVTGGVYKARERIHRGILIRDY